MKESYMTMSKKELNRVKVIEMLIQKQIKQSDAAEMLSVNVRQIRRLKSDYSDFGPTLHLPMRS